MRKILNVALVGILALGLFGCPQRTERTDGGGVLITFGQIEWPITVSMAEAIAAGVVTMETVTLMSIAKDPNGTTSALMDVEMEKFEVTFQRGDTGTRLPPTLVASLTGALPINGTLTIDNMPIMLAGQLTNPPLSDLLLINGGFDKETGADFIQLDVSIVFFGRTLSGDEVQSTPLRQTIQFQR